MPAVARGESFDESAAIFFFGTKAHGPVPVGFSAIATVQMQ
jgi:hypothetical protein